VFAQGWITGYPDGQFKPDNNITRAEAITIFNRMLERKLLAADVPASVRSIFRDLTAAHWAYADVIEASMTHEYELKANGFENWVKW
jgi:hypothetical protein